MQTVSIVKAQNFIASKDLKAFKLPTRVCGWLVPSLVLYSRASSSKRDLRKHFAFASRQNHEYSSTASASSNIQIVFQFHSRNFFFCCSLVLKFYVVFGFSCIFKTAKAYGVFEVEDEFDAPQLQCLRWKSREQQSLSFARILQ
jgi:hypothetical protein